jgi:hypothetical protein
MSLTEVLFLPETESQRRKNIEAYFLSLPGIDFVGIVENNPQSADAKIVLVLGTKNTKLAALLLPEHINTAPPELSLNSSSYSLVLVRGTTKTES